MCKKCKNNKCSGCNPDLCQVIDNINILNDIIKNVDGLVKFLNGHPIIVIDDPEDIAMFDLGTGIGSKNWIGWGVCNGNVYNGPKGVITTPDMRDRFFTGAYGTYAVGDIGGINTVTLATPELPVHTHVPTDPGHTHVVTDPGHFHNVNDPGHTHAVVPQPHQHSFTTEPADALAGHTHSYEDHQKNDIYISGANGAGAVIMVESVSTIPGSVKIGDDNDHSDTRTTEPASASSHFHTGTTDQTTEMLAVSTSTTGISVLPKVAGVTNQIASTGITIGSAGSGVAHENRPPYYAAIFVKKIF